MAYQKINLNTLPIGTVIDVMHIDDIYRAYDPSYPGPQLVIQL